MLRHAPDHRGYEDDNYRRLVWATGVEPVIARRGVPHGSALGIHRWVVERTIAWFHGFRRLRTRWERREDIHEAFLGLSYVSAVASLSSTVTPSTANVLGGSSLSCRRFFADTLRAGWSRPVLVTRIGDGQAILVESALSSRAGWPACPLRRP
ncbi:transposase [Streptomyces goshikiensis]